MRQIDLASAEAEQFRAPLMAWLQSIEAEAVLVRPDRHVFGTGTPAQIIGDLKRIRDLGFGEIVVRSRGATLAETREQIERFVGEIVPKV